VIVSAASVNNSTLLKFCVQLRTPSLAPKMPVSTRRHRSIALSLRGEANFTVAVTPENSKVLDKIATLDKRRADRGG
jgi:hypothetical protein